MYAIYDPRYAESEDDLKLLKKRMAQAELIAIDTETTGLDRFSDVIAVWSVCMDESEAWMIHARHLHLFKDIFDDPGKAWALHNSKFDKHMLANHGISLAGKVYDTLTMDWLYDENKQGLRKLGLVASRHLGITKDSFDETFRPDKLTLDWYEDMLRTQRDKLVVYATKDAWMTFRLARVLKEKLRRQGLLKIYEDHYEPLLDVVFKMERRGFLIDVEYLEEFGQELKSKMDAIKAEITRLIGRVININSTPQLRDYFYRELGIQPTRLTKTGEPSVDVHALKKIAAAGNPVAARLLEYRALSKLYGTYVEGLSKRLRPTGRIHTEFRVEGTVTGRLSSANPNLQNIPARDPMGQKIREMFIAPADSLIICGDYSQVEMRLLAHFSGDPNMIRIIKEGWDIHCGTASLMYDIPYEELYEAKKAEHPDERQKKLKKMRSDAKAIGFGLMYGMTAHRLSADLGISLEEAQELIDRFFKPFPGVKKFINDTINRTYSDLQVETLLGRPRRLSTILAGGGQRGKAERQAVNTVIQGSAADIISKAMIRIEADEELHRLGAKMLLQVHDELVFEVPWRAAERAAERIKDLMEHVVELKVPLEVDVDIGLSWAEAK